ncbi:hypothetical protein [Liquorilactobacillus mali]|uniref:Uncharacterized protein n=1 Tax=Liquorilactobacillus mali TaxID=1618 RepID=A0A0R2FS67_9LACO|nr:hypothetical protein [Liquorilactobacillus mali]KRN30475.1 hypothetical protein IV36_GL002235 [Liquorilactobacillus mali]
MRVIYPVLVEQAVEELAEGEDVTLDYKAQVYQALIKDKIIDEFGLPTEYALKQGYVESITEEPYLEWDEFLDIYPIFKKCEKSEFERIDGFWEVTTDLQKKLMSESYQATLTNIEKAQIQEFLTGRQETI